MIYFDYAASCPLDEEAAQVYIKASTEYYGNSSSLHDVGDVAHKLLENCRMEIARLIGVEKEGIYFTSGGTEGNYLAIQTLLSARLKKGKHLITGVAEHSSVGNTMEKLAALGYEVTYLPLNSTGHIDVEQFQRAIRPDTVLVSIQHGNPEIGTLQPIETIGKICKDEQILLHSDCVQSFGKVNLVKVAQSVDSLTISGHKFYGPKGTGALYFNPRLRWDAYYPGTTHENGFRPGTVNVPGIASMSVAAKKAVDNSKSEQAHYVQLRQAFLHALEPVRDQCVVYDADLPSTIGMRIFGLEGQFVMNECNRYGFAISTGSACQVSMQTPSKTMTAIGLASKPAKEFIRLTMGRHTKTSEVQQLAETIVKIIRQAKVAV